MYQLKRAVLELGGRVLDGRTALGKALLAWRRDLITDLGGESAVSTQQLALVELAVRSKLLVDSVDAYVLAMDSPVNKRKRCLFAVVTQRQALVGQLHSLLRDLGLERKARDVTDLQTYLATRTAEGHSSQPGRGARPIPESESAPHSDIPPERAESAQDRRADPGGGSPMPGEGKANDGAW